MTDETAALSSFIQPDGMALCSDDALFHIQANGDWLYLGSPLPAKFASLFSSILHCIDAEYFLITPVEKVKVTVEAYPLLLVDYQANVIDATANKLTQLVFTSSIGTQLPAIDASGIIVTDEGIYAPLVRGLVGQLNRACYYRYINQYLSFD
ncbi:DUF1285 domain-containing protein [Shewanella livingstonensis]|uniref:DUF1285 domain-containing protein n=1 Tax=Shewanella livingstonensis TaxID=150120 RepID=A0A3G8LTW4_9GAMM|nr:DUF1285 domain-containing protein [Shewanella livingstonensis]AZG73011.1 DUF1285 domain-containing protein [Shewanella livingstonensis]